MLEQLIVAALLFSGLFTIQRMRLRKLSMGQGLALGTLQLFALYLSIVLIGF